MHVKITGFCVLPWWLLRFVAQAWPRLPRHLRAEVRPFVLIRPFKVCNIQSHTCHILWAPRLDTPDLHSSYIHGAHIIKRIIANNGGLQIAVHTQT